MFVRNSKYRHVFGCPARKEQCYEGLKASKNAHDSNYCAVNPKFVAVVVESGGGGVFVALPLEKTGRVEVGVPKVCGHKGPITDLRWNPFDDNIIASCSEDATIKLWYIPDEGLSDNLTESEVDLVEHSKKVTLIEWHPSASDILLSAAIDYQCIVWNTASGSALNVIMVHQDTIFSLSWNKDGSLFSTTCKDKYIRVIDPRTGNIVAEGEGHQGNKASKVVFLADKNRLFSTGFSRSSEREFTLWELDGKGSIKSLRNEKVDSSNAILTPFYDQDTGIIYLAGKGDGNIRYFEVDDSPPYVHFLSQHQSNAPQRGLGMMPKRGVDCSRCEVTRFYKLHTLKDLCEPIAMIVPRKSEMFQADIYPPTPSSVPALTADQWLSGMNRGPVLMSLKDGSIKNAPDGSASTNQVKSNGSGARIKRNEPKKSATLTPSDYQPLHGVDIEERSFTNRTNLKSPENNFTPNNSTPPSGHTRVTRSSTLPAEHSGGFSPLGANRRGATRRRRERGEGRDDSSSCSSTEAVDQAGKSDWNENPVYNRGNWKGSAGKYNQSGNNRTGSSGYLVTNKVDVGPLDDVLQNVQSTSSQRQVSRSSHDLFRKGSSRLDDPGPVHTPEVSPTILQLQAQFQSEPDIAARRLVGSNTVSASKVAPTSTTSFGAAAPVKTNANLSAANTSASSAEKPGRVLRTRVVSSGSDFEEFSDGGEDVNGNRTNMIDCISTEAPDDVLIKPSLLRESMRSRNRFNRPSIGLQESEKVGLKRAGSLRVGSNAAARQMSSGAPAEAPSFTRGVFRTASLRESRGTRPSLADWLRADGQKVGSDGEKERNIETSENLMEEEMDSGPSSKAFNSGSNVAGSELDSSSKNLNNTSKKYQFTVPMNDSRPPRMGGGGVGVKGAVKTEATNGVSRDGLHTDYKELLSKFFQQQDEIKQLKEQLVNKDVLIRRLEDRLRLATSS